MEKKLAKLYKAVLALGIIAVVSVVFRLWIIFFIAIAMFIGARIWMRVIRAKMPKQSGTKRPAKRRSSRARKGIGEQVSMWVNADYPNAKWVWAHVDTLQRIENGEDVYIILNGAGGYRRAKVNITGHIVVALEYMKAPVPEVSEQQPVTGVAESTSTGVQNENYELMAYEWVEAHITDLNERLNEAVGHGETEYLLPATELPVLESWECVCEELKRAGLCEVNSVHDGINIKLN